MSMRPGQLIKRSHRVSLYNPAEGGATEDEWGNPIGPGFEATPVATNVECNLQPLTGDVEQTAAGREIDAEWFGSFPEATTLVEDQGIVVTAVRSGDSWVAPPASHPTRFRARQVGWEGNDWDTTAMLGVTQEAIA